MRFGKGNPGYEKYIHSSAWKMKAEARLAIDGHICQVCGRAAEEVHHLTYERFGQEEMEDLVSLCKKCHRKAEEIYDPAVLPWAMEGKEPEVNNFMAAMRVDAAAVAPVVFDYLKTTAGGGFDALMRLRQPDDPEKKKYWRVLKRSVNALCRKRYCFNYVDDRKDLMIGTITNHVRVICLQQIEHDVRNMIQAGLHETVMAEYDIYHKWLDVAADLGITMGTLTTLRKDEGKSFGPSLREAVLHYCGLDAAAGIPPIEGFECLTEEDYAQLNAWASYVNSVSGSEAFRRESL